VEEKLKRGARVADVGCGHGASTILMAQAYPESEFFGFDYHAPSIEIARMTAEMAGVQDRCTFEAAPSKSFPGGNYDLVAFLRLPARHGRPVGAAQHVRQSLAPGGTWMIVEPFANDRLEDNLNPIGRVFYTASTLICTPASRAQEVGLALGAQAGEARLHNVAEQGGFTHFRRATGNAVQPHFGSAGLRAASQATAIGAHASQIAAICRASVPQQPPRMVRWRATDTQGADFFAQFAGVAFIEHGRFVQLGVAASRGQLTRRPRMRWTQAALLASKSAKCVGWAQLIM
jgi:SAM-dependent methyltransferase